MASWAELLTLAGPGEHVVQLYGEDDQLLARNVSRYLAEGLRRGDGLVVIGTPEHTEAVARHLVEEAGVPADARGRLACLDARATLDRVCSGGELDGSLFGEVVGGILSEARERSGTGSVRASCGMVSLLWCEERYTEAWRLEDLWNGILTAHSCSLFCAYPVDLFDRDGDLAALHPIVCAHHQVLAGSSTVLTSGRPRG